MTQRSMARVGAGRGNRDRRAVLPAAGPARELDRTTDPAAPLPEHHDRPAGKQIRNLLRLDVVGVEAGDLDVDVGEHRRVDVAAQAHSRIWRLTWFGDDERLAEPGARDAFDEIAVHGAADAEREEVGAVELRPDVVEHVALRLDVTVGEQDDAA